MGEERRRHRVGPIHFTLTCRLPSTLMPEPAKAIVVQNVNRRNQKVDAYGAADQWGKGAKGGAAGAKGRGKTYKGTEADLRE